MPLSATWSDILTTIGTDGFIASTVAQSAKMNQGVLQNLLWLKGRPYALVSDFDGTVFSTTSSTFQDTGIAATLTTTGGRVLVVAFGTVTTADSTIFAHLTMYQDGVNAGHTTEGMVKAKSLSNGLTAPFCLAYLTPTAPSEAAHTWKVYLRSSGTASVGITQIQMWALEIGA